MTRTPKPMSATLEEATQVRLRLAARAWSRICGGYGFVGQWRGIIGGSICAACLWTAQVLVASLFQSFGQDTCSLEDCMITVADVQHLISYSVALVLVLFPTEVFIKPWARSMPISHALHTHAANGVPEAAFALAELHLEQGAEREAQFWLKRAADFRHYKAIQQLKRLQT